MSKDLSHDERHARAASLEDELEKIEEKKGVYNYNAKTGLSCMCKDCIDYVRNNVLKHFQNKYELEPLDFYMMGCIALERQCPMNEETLDN